MTATTPGYRGRFAPSPTGPLHLGSLTAALGSWLMARHHGGSWMLRIEDLDPPREMAGAAQRQIDDLAAFGMVSDEPVLWQHERTHAYAQALERLLDSGLAFACRCSRSALAASGGVHHACVGHSQEASDDKRLPAIRLRVDAGHIVFDDAIHGHLAQDVRRHVGDFVLRRADGLWAYQLAVVVDDAAQRITQVVRGADLLDSTPRQILLQRALGVPTPAYAHLPLVLDVDGRKLSKSDCARPVDPRDPRPALRLALSALGQDARVLDGVGRVEAVLQCALAAFCPERIPSTPPPASAMQATASADKG